MIAVAAVRLAILGAVLIAVGFCLASPPAGLVIAGLELLTASYVAAYVKANEQVKR